jgi:hypothetical protein
MNIPRNSAWNIVHITNTATLRNSEFIADKFGIVYICTHGNCAQELVSKRQKLLLLLLLLLLLFA